VTAQVTIITPTYNKPTYFQQCLESVLQQTYQDWAWWVILNPDESTFTQGLVSGYAGTWQHNPKIVPILYPVTSEHRKQWHVPAQIVNFFYPKVQTPYIYFLADDDLIDKEGIKTLIDHQEYIVGINYASTDAVYGRCEVQDEQPDGNFKTSCWCFEGMNVGLGTGIEPDCRLDGGQVLHTKALWDKATADGWQLSDRKEDAGHNDGQLLNRLAQFATFHYVPQKICTHRRTRLSESHRPQL
jgi:cellulose synthase/poly-beta-1,6-N-acetylglucosamine synthase-like glycosyltransferase